MRSRNGTHSNEPRLHLVQRADMDIELEREGELFCRASKPINLVQSHKQPPRVDRGIRRGFGAYPSEGYATDAGKTHNSNFPCIVIDVERRVSFSRRRRSMTILRFERGATTEIKCGKARFRLESRLKHPGQHSGNVVRRCMSREQVGQDNRPCSPICNVGEVGSMASDWRLGKYVLIPSKKESVGFPLRVRAAKRR